MITKEQQQIIKSIIKQNGIDEQQDKTIEELAELIQAIVKFRYLASKSNFKNLVEEIADTEIMLEQNKTYYDIHGEVQKIKDEKIQRIKDKYLINLTH